MTVISYKHKFIFIHPRRTGGTSLKLALLKFCGEKDIVSDIKENQRKWITFKPTANYNLEVTSKKLNINGFYTFITSFIKVLPLLKSIFKFNYPPNFSLKIPLYIQKTEYKFYTHCPIKKVRKIVGNDFFNEAFKFTIVRNPYDQFLSFYMGYHSKRNFQEFTKKEASYFFNRENSDFHNKTLPYDKIIKYENFKEDIEQLSKLLKLPENLYEIFKNINASKAYGKKDLNMIDKDSQKIIYKNAYHFFKLFGYSKDIKVE